MCCQQEKKNNRMFHKAPAYFKNPKGTEQTLWVANSPWSSCGWATSHNTGWAEGGEEVQGRMSPQNVHSQDGDTQTSLGLSQEPMIVPCQDA